MMKKKKKDIIIMNNCLDSLKETISSVIVGNRKTTDLLLTCLLAEGHALLLDKPGYGKTLLARTLASATSLSFGRIQFVPDLLPSDITGSHIYQPDTGKVIFKKGPAFAQILLADEINRATPRTQAALLECMQERQITVDDETFSLSSPFMVVATENPLEQAGTFPLPEAQTDRFLMCLPMEELTAEQEQTMLMRFLANDPLASISPVAGEADILDLIRQAAAVRLHPDLAAYIVALSRMTRTMNGLLGALSQRATLAMGKAAKAYALIRGRDYVVPEDITELAPYVWAHRLVIDSFTHRQGEKEMVIKDLLGRVPVPTEEWDR